MREHGKTLAITVSVVLLVACIALFVKSYKDAGPDNAGKVADPALPTDSLAPVTPSAAPSSSGARRSAGSLLPESLSLPKYTINPREPGGFTIAPIPEHTLVLSARSAGRIVRVGYIAPTSKDHPVGDVKVPGNSWSLTTTVTGKPYYAAIFVQSGPSGTPITCTVSLDGQVLDSKTTTGPYSRQVCVG